MKLRAQRMTLAPGTLEALYPSKSAGEGEEDDDEDTVE
jgi:hypothetical protein